MNWTNLKTALTVSGTRTVTLTNNVARDVDETINVTGTVTLDLNGYTIDGGTTQTSPILNVDDGVSLTITDSRTGGTITGNDVGVNVASATATFTVSGNVNIGVSLYYDGSNFNPINIGGTLNEATRIGIKISDDAATAITGSVVKVFTSGLKGYGTRENFVLNGREGHALANLESGEMAVAKPYLLTVPTGVTVSGITAETDGTYKVGCGDVVTLNYGGSVGTVKSVRYIVPDGAITYLGTVDVQGKCAKFTMPGENTIITETANAQYTFGGITLKEAFSGSTSQGLDAIFDGSSEVTISIQNNIEVKSVDYNRNFTTGTAATVMLPFNYTCTGNEGGKFYSFAGVEKYDTKWVATMKEKGNPATMTFDISSQNDQKVTLNTDGNHMTEKDYWVFNGVYQKKVWDGGNYGYDYGFAARNGRDTENTQDITAGQFVCLAPNAFIKPMRCYLTFNPPSNARGMNRTAAADEVPQTITVRLVSRSGDTTDIGTIDTRTGEFTPDGWYDLNGKKLSGKPTTKGVYIRSTSGRLQGKNNGKKIVIK